MQSREISTDAAHVDVAIVGGGLAGLVAAANLARAGHRVALIERGAALGGRAASERRHDVHLDRGPRALYVRGSAERGLKRLGIEPAGERPDLAGRMWTAHADHPLPATPWRLLTSPALPGRARWQLMRTLMALPRLDLDPWRGRPLGDWLAGHAPEAAAALAMFIRLSTYCHPVDDLDAADALAQLAAAGRGVRYLHGGWQSMVDALAAVAEGAGVHRVQGRALRWRDGGFDLGDDRRITAQVPLVAAGPRVAEAIYGVDGLAGEPVRAACLTVALDRDRGPRFVLGRDVPLYAAVASRTARLGPPGGAVVHLMRNLAPGERGHGHRPALEAALERMHPGWRTALHTARWMPEMTITHRRPTVASGGLGGRPPIEPRPGCFVAGDWVGSRGWLADAAVASAEAAARAIDERLAARAAA